LRENLAKVVYRCFPFPGKELAKEGKIVQDEPCGRDYKDEDPTRLKKANGLFKKGPVQVVLALPGGKGLLVEVLDRFEDVNGVFAGFSYDAVRRVAQNQVKGLPRLPEE
jgi:hypothetical protein